MGWVKDEVKSLKVSLGVPPGAPPAAPALPFRIPSWLLGIGAVILGLALIPRRRE